MSSNIVKLPRSRPRNLDGLIAEMREKYPNATRGIFIIFPEDGKFSLDACYSCNDKEMAVASLMLGKTVTEWDEDD